MNEVSTEFPTETSPLTACAGVSLGKLKPLLESVPNLDGVCDREAAFEEHRDDGDEFIFSRGISSLLRGLPSRDFGVLELDRFFDPSRDFESDGVLMGVLDDLDELRRLDDSLKGESLMGDDI